jgi:transcriptional regulator
MSIKQFLGQLLTEGTITKISLFEGSFKDIAIEVTQLREKGKKDADIMKMLKLSPADLKAIDSMKESNEEEIEEEEEVKIEEGKFKELAMEIMQMKKKGKKNDEIIKALGISKDDLKAVLSLSESDEEKVEEEEKEEEKKIEEEEEENIKESTDISDAALSALFVAVTKKKPVIAKFVKELEELGFVDEKGVTTKEASKYINTTEVKNKIKELAS